MQIFINVRMFSVLGSLETLNAGTIGIRKYDRSIMTSYNTPLPLKLIVAEIVMGEEKGIHQALKGVLREFRSGDTAQYLGLYMYNC